jgi:hypothetical protein
MIMVQSFLLKDLVMKKWFIAALMISVCPILYVLLKNNIADPLTWVGILAIAGGDILIFVIVSKISSTKNEIHPVLNNQ